MARSYQLKSKRSPNAAAIDFASLLNPQQLEAVTAKPGPSLVIAGAGSGKTRTLTYRVAYLLEKGIDPNHILLLTFTNKAAREMTGRVSALVPGDVMAIWSGTFHSIGNRILRKHGDRLGFTRSFTIMDRDDQNSLITLAKNQAKIDKNKQTEKRFPKASILADVYSMARNLDRPLQDILHERYEHLSEYWDEITEIERVYEAKKLDSNSMDFDDLLCKTLRLLSEHQDLREGYQEKFKAILVDEYQDTNPVQSKLIDLFAKKHRHLMVVGDDAQSIYSWRGADFRNIMEFDKRYKDAKVYKIETNYRSVPEVLALANESISANVHQFEKELQPARESMGTRPALVPLNDPNAQAAFVGQRLQELHEKDGIPYAEMAVLYRAHFQAMELQMELTNLNVPFCILSGLRFFEQAHIKDVTSFLRFVVNPRDEVAFKRMLILVNGIGDVTAEKLWQSWLSCDASNPANPRPESYSKLLHGFRVSSRSVDDWKQLGYVLDELVKNGEPVEPAEMIKSIVDGVYDDYMKTQFTNYERRKQDIEQFARYCEQHQDVREMLEKLSLLGNIDDDHRNKRKRGDEDEVTLSSVHQAKGLEWKVVFVIWLADGMFPNRRIMESDFAAEAFEEERRLFYVAVTRACDQLYLTYPLTRPTSNWGGDYNQLPSAFLQELPLELMEEWDVGDIW